MLEQQTHRGDHEHNGECLEDLVVDDERVWGQPEPGNGRAGPWNTSECQTTDDPPVDASAIAKGCGSGNFRDRREGEIGADSGGGRLAEDENEERSRERAPTDTGEAYHDANEKTDSDVSERIRHDASVQPAERPGFDLVVMRASVGGMMRVVGVRPAIG